MDANEDYLDSLLNSVLSQESGGGDGSIQQNSGSEAELEEINDLLKKSDQNQMPDAEMLAILERAENESQAESSDNDVPDVFDIFSSESMEAEEDHAEPYAAEEPAQNEGGKEAYLDALLDGTAADDMAEVSDQPAEEPVSLDDSQSGGYGTVSGSVSEEENILSLDDLQMEEEPEPEADTSDEENILSLDGLQMEEEPALMGDTADTSGEENILSLDDLQMEEEPEPEADTSDEENILSLDGLQIEEEPQPEESAAGEEDFLSLDSLQTEEEPAPEEEAPDGGDFLSLDGLQMEEEPQPEEAAAGEDFLSLDSLQGGESMDFEPSAEDDEAIQKEIDELLGLAEDQEAEPTMNGGAAGERISEPADGVEDASHKKEKKEKKKKKKLFGNKKKDAAEPALDEAGEGASADMGNAGQIDENDAVSMELSDDEMTADALSDSGQDAEAPADGKKKKAKTKEKREKAKKQKTADSENGQKEPGFFARMLNGLFEEVDEEEEQPQELEVSDENREIMAMMENEKIDNKKPGSKKKAKKGKKGKADAKQEEDADGDEEAPVDEKKAQKEKKKKEKKEKKEQKRKEKQEKEQEEKAAAKKLPKGKVFSVFAFCLTILAVIVILCIVIPQQRDLKTAREAYYDHDYLTVYQNMDGKNLSDSDYILYMRSRMVLNMQGKLDNYLVYLGMDKEMAALNELMLAVHYYQTNRAAAEGYGALEEMSTVYEQVLSILSQQYQLSEADAVEIFALDDLSYNERLYYLVHGTEFVAPGVPQSGTEDGRNSSAAGGSEDAALDDVLPEENEMIADDQPQDAVNVTPGNGADTESAGTPDDWQANRGDGTQPTDNGTENFGTDPSAGQSVGADAGGEGQPQNTPGESLSQGNGDVLYSGEVQNGNAVLQ